jgi:hypothetical protein
LKFASVSFYCQVSDTGSVGWASSSFFVTIFKVIQFIFSWLSFFFKVLLSLF